MEVDWREGEVSGHGVQQGLLEDLSTSGRRGSFVYRIACRGAFIDSYSH
jgi:hypothetical protein